MAEMSQRVLCKMRQKKAAQIFAMSEQQHAEVDQTPKQEKFRLPNGTTLASVYNSESETWTTTAAANGIETKAEHTSIHTTIMKAGRKLAQKIVR